MCQSAIASPVATSDKYPTLVIARATAVEDVKLRCAEYKGIGYQVYTNCKRTIILNEYKHLTNNETFRAWKEVKDSRLAIERATN